MQWLKICILLFIPMAIYIPTTPASAEGEFARIITLSDAEQRLVNTPEPYSYNNYLTFALLASGVLENQIPRYKGAVDQIATALAKGIETKRVSNAPEERAEFILGWLHLNFFKRYSPHQTRIDQMLEHRTFNCVSSGVFYNVICRKFGMHTTGVIVPDHAFSQLKMPREKIDIETTVHYGFDPTSKKDLFDEFGRLTGFVYVPQKNYRQRSEISDKEMIALIYSNRYKELSDRRRCAKAAKVLYVGWRLAGDLPHSLNTWESAIGNYIVDLDRSRQFTDALYVADEANRRFPDLRRPAELRRTIYTNWGYHNLRAKQYDEAIRILKQGLSVFPRDPRLLQNLKAAYLENAQALGRAGRFSEAHAVVEMGRQKFPREEKFRKVGPNLYIREAEKLPMAAAATLYQNALQKYPQEAVLLEAFAFLYIEPAQGLGNHGKYEEAIQLLDQSEKLMPMSPKIGKAKVAIYNNWSINLAKERDFTKAKLVIERGLAISPADATLRNNGSYVLLQWADFEFKNGRFDQATAILLEGLKKAKSDRAMFLQTIEAYYNESAVQLLKRGEIKKGTERLMAGLKIVPHSKVMKDNLKLVRQQQR